MLASYWPESLSCHHPWALCTGSQASFRAGHSDCYFLAVWPRLDLSELLLGIVKSTAIKEVKAQKSRVTFLRSSSLTFVILSPKTVKTSSSCSFPPEFLPNGNELPWGQQQISNSFFLFFYHIFEEGASHQAAPGWPETSFWLRLWHAGIKSVCQHYRCTSERTDEKQRDGREIKGKTVTAQDFYLVNWCLNGRR